MPKLTDKADPVLHGLPYDDSFLESFPQPQPTIVYWRSFLHCTLPFIMILPWRAEIFFISTGCAGAITIAVLLYHYDGRPLPHFDPDISFNSLLTIPAKVIELVIGTVGSSVLIQRGWLWYRGPARPLDDLRAFWKGATSAAELIKIIKRTGLSLETLLCIALALNLATSFVVQQSNGIKTVMVSSGFGSVPKVTNVTRPLSTMSISNPDDAMIASWSYGFVGPADQIIRIPAKCPGAQECRWNFMTIAVGHICENITDLVVPCDVTTDICTVMLANTTAGPLTVGPSRASASIGYLDPDFLTDYPWYLQAWKVLSTFNETGKPSVVAYQCKLYPDIQNLSASMINGTYEEHQVSPAWHNTSAPASTNDQWLMNPDGNLNDTMNIQNLTVESFQRFAVVSITGNSTSSAFGEDFGGNIELQVQHPSLGDGTFPKRVANQAAALSLTLRLGTNDSSSAPPEFALGPASKQELRVHVKYPWLLSTLLVLLILLFVLLCTMFETAKAGIPVWKDDVLALISQAPAEIDRNAIERVTGTSDLFNRDNCEARFKSQQGRPTEPWRWVYEGGAQTKVAKQRHWPSWLRRRRQMRENIVPVSESRTKLNVFEQQWIQKLPKVHVSSPPRSPTHESSPYFR